jgi:hypothetical protein
MKKPTFITEATVTAWGMWVGYQHRVAAQQHAHAGLGARSRLDA